MTARRHDITELELLALVEGDNAALPAERRETLLADATVVRLVAKLTADREHLAALPRREAAPDGLVSGAIDRAEREALAALAAAEPASGAQLRSSSTIVERRGLLARLLDTRWPRRFAAAAGVAIACLGVYFAAAALIDWNLTKPTRVVVNPPRPAPPSPAADPTTPAPRPIEIASAPDPAAPAQAPALTVPNGPIDTATAVSLVPQGRVVLVLRSNQPQKDFGPISVAVLRKGGATMWQPLAADSPEYSAALAAAKASGFAVPPSVQPPSIALIGLNASTQSFETLIASLRADLATGAPERSPQWAAVDAAALKLTHDRAAVLSLQPHRVLWWEQGSAAWAPSTVIPVVILPE